MRHNKCPNRHARQQREDEQHDQHQLQRNLPMARPLAMPSQCHPAGGPFPPPVLAEAHERGSFGQGDLCGGLPRPPDHWIVFGAVRNAATALTRTIGNPTVSGERRYSSLTIRAR
jgi:hypothetical protein